MSVQATLPDDLTESISDLIAAIASYSDPQTLRLLAECQQCRNNLMYLLDTRSRRVMPGRVLGLHDDHARSNETHGSEKPRIRVNLS